MSDSRPTSMLPEDHTTAERPSVGGGGWRPESRRFRILAGVVLVLFAAYWLAFVALTIRRGSATSGDFFGLWSVGKFVAAHPAAQVYEAPALRAYQLALGMDPRSDYPFPYPPFFLLALRPLAALPYLSAYLLTLGGTLILYLWATVGREWRMPLLAAAVFAPASAITLAAGQAGFLSAALLVGGYRLVGRRPVIAGVLFGLAAFKPQLGLLVPVALIAACRWRSVAAAVLTVFGLAAAATAVFGAAVWPAWIASLSGYSEEFASANGKVGHLMPTVLQCLTGLGLPPSAAVAGQIAAATVAAGAVWYCFRRGPGLLAAAAALVATFLATPHAFVYDMPSVTTAVLWVILERYRAATALAKSEIVVMILALLSPIMLVAGGTGPPVAVLALSLLLVAIVRRCRAPPDVALAG